MILCLTHFDNLKYFLGYDLPGLKKIIEKYGEETVKKASYAGKEGVRFWGELPQVQSAIPGVIDKFLAENKKSAALQYVVGLPRLLFLSQLIQFAKDFSAVFPDDAAIKSKIALTEQTYQDALNAAPYIVGNFHKSHIGEVVIFKNTCVVGKEDAAQVTNIISPENGLQLMAYFPYNLKGNKYEPGMRMQLSNLEHHQEIFFWDANLGETGHIAFNLFPDPASLNFSSHLQYEQHINFLSRLLDLPNGKHPVTIGFYRSPMEKIYTENRNPLYIEITDANKTKIKALRDLLVEKRIASVVMPECGDNNSMISNKSDLAKYGTFLKFVGTTTIEEVKDPNWPFPVIGHGTAGWAAIERPNGTVEIIPLTLFKAVGQTTWMFKSIAPMSARFDLRAGTKTYNSGRGEFGYLMKKENVAKCGKWK